MTLAYKLCYDELYQLLCSGNSDCADYEIYGSNRYIPGMMRTFPEEIQEALAQIKEKTLEENE